MMVKIIKNIDCEINEPTYTASGDSIQCLELMRKYGESIALELMKQVMEQIVKEFQRNPAPTKQLSFIITCEELKEF